MVLKNFSLEITRISTNFVNIFSSFSAELVTRNTLELVTRNSLDKVMRISSEWVTRNSADLVPRNGLKTPNSCGHFHQIFLGKISGNFRGFSVKLLLGKVLTDVITSYGILGGHIVSLVN